jgi:hypothetical protein
MVMVSALHVLNGFAPALRVRCSAISQPAHASVWTENWIGVVKKQCQCGAELSARDFNLVELHSERRVALVRAWGGWLAAPCRANLSPEVSEAIRC